MDSLVEDGRVKVGGAPGQVAKLMSLVDTFPLWFDIVTPDDATE